MLERRKQSRCGDGAAEVDPDHLECRLLLADYYAMEEKLEGSRGRAGRAVSFGAGQRPASGQCGGGMHGGGRLLGGARRHFAQAIRANPRRPEGLCRPDRACCSSPEENLTEAAALAEKLVRLDPDARALPLRWARCRWDWTNGQTPAARAAAERAGGDLIRAMRGTAISWPGLQASLQAGTESAPAWRGWSGRSRSKRWVRAAWRRLAGTLSRLGHGGRGEIEGLLLLCVSNGGVKR